MSSALVSIGDRQLSLSNLGKVFYPLTGFTKGQVLDYYARIAPYLLPHLQDRPLTLKRYPEGVEGLSFYEKRSPSHRPKWVQTFRVKKEGEADIPYTLINDLPTLIWVANLASIELHPSLSTAPRLEQPTMVVFDLDPGPPAGALECCQVALLLRGLFTGLGLESFIKSSGSKGMQVYVPLNTPTTYHHTKGFAHAVAQALEARRPEQVVSRMTKALRTGKVLVDWSQNDVSKTTVCVYSLRARERPTVSAPVEWEEVTRAVKKGDPAPLFPEAGEAVRRAERGGDLFAPLLSLKQTLPELGGALDSGHGKRRTGSTSRRRA